jgi:hypothetical protein
VWHALKTAASVHSGGLKAGKPFDRTEHSSREDGLEHLKMLTLKQFKLAKQSTRKFPQDLKEDTRLFDVTFAALEAYSLCL